MTGRHSDCTLRVDDETGAPIPAHRLVLDLGSPWCFAMLRSGMAEARTGRIVLYDTTYVACAPRGFPKRVAPVFDGGTHGAGRCRSPRL